MAIAELTCSSAQLRVGDFLLQYMGSEISPPLLVLSISEDRMHLSDDLIVHLDREADGWWLIRRPVAPEVACREIAQWLQRSRPSD